MGGLDHEFLVDLQQQPLEYKENYATLRINEWYDHWKGQVYVAFSGGKDSTVLLDLVRKQHPEVPAVFHDSGLEFPEIRDFVKTVDNVVWLKPKKTFKQVIEEYGYPIISKEQSGYIERVRRTKNPEVREKLCQPGPFSISQKWQFLIEAPFLISGKCCDVLKKDPAHRYERETGRKVYLGLLASESRNRKMMVIKQGCNAYFSSTPASRPLMIWNEDDIWGYIRKYDIPYSSIYDKGYYRTGCMFCMFGLHLDGSPNRFELMEKTHPKHFDYCMNKLGCKEIIRYIREESGELPPELKLCHNCMQILPANQEVFPPRNNRTRGLQPLCRTCFNERRRATYKAAKEKTDEKALC